MATLSKIEQTHLQVMDYLQKTFVDVRRYEQQYELVREIDAEILNSTFSPQHVLELIVEKCLAHAEAHHGQVVLWRGGQLIVAASSEPTRIDDELPLEGSLSGRAVRKRRDLHYPDLSKLPEGSYIRYHDSTQSELVLLIQPLNEGRVLGVIDLERNETGRFSESARAFAHLLRGQAAIAIEHARIATGVKTLYEISNEVASGTLGLQESCSAILSALLSKSDFRDGQILMREGNELVILASSRREDI
ncbi:MAG TPA: GAF domain-containing protein, partial [Thermoanaerobaculia bacterium]|nr:GAF domain-containing protein [Thermoanaerobaculia bacterium]